MDFLGFLGDFLDRPGLVQGQQGQQGQLRRLAEVALRPQKKRKWRGWWLELRTLCSFKCNMGLNQKWVVNTTGWWPCKHFRKQYFPRIFRELGSPWTDMQATILTIFWFQLVHDSCNSCIVISFIVNQRSGTHNTCETTSAKLQWFHLVPVPILVNLHRSTVYLYI